MPRLLFLSHSGIDTEAAKALKARLLAAPPARDNGLGVWLDKDDLRAGEPWQSQLEEAIGRSHTFAVYVGSKGVVNWVEAEVRLALNRAITEPDYRFVPILAGTAPGPEALPGFAQQFQGVLDVEASVDQFEKLVRAVLGGAEAGQLQLETEPFFGLRAIDESRSHLFFGRRKETEALVALVHRTPLVLVTGDSGSGKSSLVRAGLVPRFRGGALALLDGARPEDAIWHVVTTRPRNQPFRQLGDAVDDAAKGLGLSLADRGTLADWAMSGEIDKVRRGLRCDLPSERVQVLLVVDQFEELLTITPSDLRAPFIDLLLDLSDPREGRHKVVLTMRHDYANLCNAYERLKERLDADDRRARFLLGRMSDDGLRRIVTEPLRLAAIEAADREALAGEVLRDVGERPGDLALVQMALTETWHTRDQHGGDLLRAYAAVGRVEGALAKAAEHVRTKLLDAAQREFLDSILLRLVRLGDTGGATRRVAARGEFDDTRWALIQELATDEGKRLLLLRGSEENPTVEIAHEALVTAWPYFQNLLQETAEDKRILDTLIPRAQAWVAQNDQSERDKRRATGADLELFGGLRDRRPAWLSNEEREFVEDSLRHERQLVEQEEQRQRQELERVHQLAESERLRAEEQERASRRNRRLAYVAGLLFLIAAGVGGFAWDRMRAAETAEQVAIDERERAQREGDLALRQQSRLLARLSKEALDQGDPRRAARLALAGLPSPLDWDARPWEPQAVERLRAAMWANLGAELGRHEGGVNAVAWASDGRVVSGGTDGKLLLWDAAAPGKPATELGRHEGWVNAVAWASDGRVVSGGNDGKLLLWDAVAPGKPATELGRHEGGVTAVAWASDGRVVSGGNDGKVLLWDAAAPGKPATELGRHEGGVTAVAWASDGRVVSGGDYGKVLLWDAAAPGKPATELGRHEGWVRAVAWASDGRVVSGDHDGKVLLWDAAAPGKPATELGRHEGGVTAVAWASDGRVVSGGYYGKVLLWDAAAPGKPATELGRHEGGVNAVAWASDGRVVSGGEDGKVLLWDAAAPGKPATELGRHEGWVRAVAWASDGRVVSGGDDGKVLQWDAAAPGKPATELGRHEHGVKAVAWASDGRVVSGGEDGKVLLWDAAAPGKPATELGRHEHGVKAVAWASDGRVVSGDHDGKVLLWDAAAPGKPATELGRHEGGVTAVAWASDGRVVSGGYYGKVLLWDAAAPGKPATELGRHEGWVNAVAWASDGRVVSGGEDGKVLLWDAAAPGKPATELGRHEGWVNAVAWASDGRVVSGGEDDKVLLWDAAAPGKPATELGRHESRVRAVAWASDGRVVSGGEDGKVLLWDEPLSLKEVVENVRARLIWPDLTDEEKALAGTE